jgi:NAD(P)H-dependent FMN reductase
MTEIYEMLQNKFNILKKNIDAVGQEALETKYATAYGKLLSEINGLSDDNLKEQIMFLDLTTVNKEVIPTFRTIIANCKKKASEAIKKADFDAYEKIVSSSAKAYAEVWCNNVEKAHAEGEAFVFDPFA